MIDFLIVSIAVTMCLYVLIDRICTCFEKCYTNRTYGDVYKEALKKDEARKN